MPCASSKRPSTSPCRNAARSRSATPSRRRTIAPLSNKRCGRDPRKHCPSSTRTEEYERVTPMPSLPRTDRNTWVDQWLEANRECERNGDWKPLADFYTDDATYGWNIGPKEDVMCVGKDEIRDVALG